MNKPSNTFLGLVLIVVIGCHRLLQGGAPLPEPGNRQARDPASSLAVDSVADGKLPVSTFSAVMPPDLSSDMEGQSQPDSMVLQRVAHSLYTRLEREQLRMLAVNGNAHAQEVLAMEICLDQPDEALQLAMRAAEQGRPLAAVLVSDILAKAKGDPAGGYAYLAEFERNHGEDALVSRYRKAYPAVHGSHHARLGARTSLSPQSDEMRVRIGSPEL